MVSLWGTKKADDQDGDFQDEEEVLVETSSTGRTPRVVNVRRVEPDERSALLGSNPPPRMPRADGYLHPDDPAVSVSPLTVV